MDLGVRQAQCFHFLPDAPDFDTVQHQIGGGVVAQRTHEVGHIPQPQGEWRAEVLELSRPTDFVDLGEHHRIVQRQLMLFGQVEEGDQNGHLDE